MFSLKVLKHLINSLIVFYFIELYQLQATSLGPWNIVSTLAGSEPGYQDGPGIDARFFYPNGIAVDESGTLYVADSNNNRIRMITPQRNVTTIAGSDPGYQDGPGIDAKFFILMALLSRGKVHFMWLIPSTKAFVR